MTRAGFTLVELMVALTVGGIAISSIYAVGSASTRHFREQQRVSTTQSSLRAALNQVKRDFQRAGFMATPNITLAAERCEIASTSLNETGTALGRGRLAGISAYHHNVTPPEVLDTDKLNSGWAQVDDILLMGNYASSGEYMGIVLSPDGKTVTLPDTMQSFRRDFSHWFAADGQDVGDCNEAALKAAFARGRMVRVREVTGRKAFAQISDARCGTGGGVVDLETAISNDCNVNGGWIAPVSTIRYWVDKSSDKEATRTGDNRVAVLRRTEVDPTRKDRRLDVAAGGVNRPADERTVLDYVVRFSVGFMLRDNTRSVNYAPAAEADVNANPELVRGAVIEIAARTAEHEPDMDMTVTGTALRLPPFRVLKTQGAARTRALRAELLLPNIALEGY